MSLQAFTPRISQKWLLYQSAQAVNCSNDGLFCIDYNLPGVFSAIFPHAVYFLFDLLHLSEIYSTILIKFPKGWLDVSQSRTPSWKNMNCNLREPVRSLAKIRRENIICHYYYDCKTTIVFAFPLLIIIYNLLIESVVIIGKSQTEA